MVRGIGRLTPTLEERGFPGEADKPDAARILASVIGIVGAGAMGSALAIHLARADRDVTIFATEFDAAVVAAHLAGAPHPALGVTLPDVAIVDPDAWPEMLGELDQCVLAVSTAGLVPTVRRVAPLLAADAIWVIATKGWDAASLRPAQQIVVDETSEDRVVALVGPSLAAEVARATPTALICASRSAVAARRVADAFASPTLRTYTSLDVTGVEVGAILKNVIAIAIGIIDGLAGEATSATAMLNTKSFLFARGLLEMATLAEALGGRPETVLGLSGAGDLFVTALGGRNGRFGRLLGSGFSIEDALAEVNSTVEGVANAPTAVALAQRCGIELPLVSAVARILEGADARTTIDALFQGDVGPER
jgi:glycerol-3-phosphate dehydrogenase (NAD(P)+)